jgi:hypothetical protein
MGCVGPENLYAAVASVLDLATELRLHEALQYIILSQFTAFHRRHRIGSPHTVHTLLGFP